jgi:hypothetical protein
VHAIAETIRTPRRIHAQRRGGTASNVQAACTSAALTPTMPAIDTTGTQCA